MKTTFTQGQAVIARIQSRIFFLIVLFLFGFQYFKLYAQGMYTSKSLVTTEFTQSHQAEIRVGVSSGLESTLAYSITPKWFAFSQLGWFSETWDLSAYQEIINPRSKDFMIRNGLGYIHFTPQSPLRRWEILAGTAFSATERNPDPIRNRGNSYTAKAESRQLFAQVNADIASGLKVYTLSMRLSVLEFTKVGSRDWKDFQRRQGLGFEKARAAALDLSGTIRHSFQENFHIQFQAGFSLPFLGSPLARPLIKNQDPSKANASLMGSAMLVYRLKIPKVKSKRTN